MYEDNEKFGSTAEHFSSFIYYHDMVILNTTYLYSVHVYDNVDINLINLSAKHINENPY